MPTKTKTPAEIPAETTTAQQTRYEPALPLDLIRVHPKNIRHNATADDELLASVREQGLLQPLVAYSNPALEGVDLIAGHRRLDALLRTGYTHAPVILRYDLADEADQIAAMLVENGRRADLSPIEEAEGFDLLSELGWNAEKIATASGRSKTLVAERRKLTKLTQRAKSAVDAGQVTIDDAVKLAKLPPAEQKTLEKSINTSDFRYAIARAEERVKAQRDVDAEAKRLRATGVPEIKPATAPLNSYYLSHAEHGMARLGVTGKPDSSDHAGCLAFMIAGTKQYPAIYEGCTDPGRHDADLNDEQRARQAAVDAEQAEAEQLAQEAAQRREAEKIAAALRADTLLDAIKVNKAIDPTLEALLRLTLPNIVDCVGVADRATFSRHARIPEDVEPHRCGDWLEENLHAAIGPDVIRTLAAILISEASYNIGSLGQHSDGDDLRKARGYFNLLAAVGHETNTVDQVVLDRLAELEQAGTEGGE